MDSDVRYAVFLTQKDEAVGHFFNGKNYEPFGGEQQLGHLDSSNNFVYYIVTPENPTPKIHGRLEGNILIREKDGQRFQIQPV